MKTLQELCLECIGINFITLHNDSALLPKKYKEFVLEWLICHNRLTDATVDLIIRNRFLTSVKSFRAYKSEQLDERNLKHLSTCGWQLRDVFIHGCPLVGDFGINCLLTEQSQIESLTLRKLKSFSGRPLANIAAVNLEKADFRGCSILNSAGVISLVSRCTNIKSLTLCDCKALDNSIFPAIADCLGDRLEELDLTQLLFVNDDSLQILASKCVRLKRLNLCSCTAVTSKGFSKLFESCTRLESLDLSYCFGLRDAVSAQCLLQLPSSLRELSLCGVWIQDKSLFCAALSPLSSLKCVRLSGVPALNDDTLHEVLSKVGAHLTELDLNGSVSSAVTDAGLTSIVTYCTSLHRLGLSQLPLITGATLLPLISDPKRASLLQHLSLSFPKVTETLVHEVSRQCHNLETLDVSGVLCVDDELLITLSNHCPTLSQLYIKGCKQVTDIGVSALASKLTSLTALSLSGLFQLTDRSILELARNCHHLREIYLNGCERVTYPALFFLIDACMYRLYVENLVPHADPDMVMARNVDTGEFCRLDMNQLTTFL